MFLLLRNERLKLRRKKVLLVIPVMLALYVAFLLKSVFDPRENVTDFAYLFLSNTGLLIFGHAIMIGLLGAALLTDESKYNTLQSIRLAPQSMASYLLGKMAVITIISTLASALNACAVLAVGILSGCHNMNATTVGCVLLTLLLFAVGMPLALLPVYFVSCVFPNGFILPVITLLLYLFGMIFASMGVMNVDDLKYIHPVVSLAGLYNVLGYHWLPDIYSQVQIEEINVTASIVNIVLVAALFFILTVFFLNRQETREGAR